MNSDRNLVEGRIRAHLWRIALPAGTGMFFNTMFNVVDTYFAGTVSTNALAALSLCFPVFFIVIALTIGLWRAGSALVAYHLGRNSDHQAKLYAAQVLSYSILLTFIIMFLGVYSAQPAFQMIGAEGELLQYSLDYINTIFYGSFFFVFSATINSILLAYGNSKAMRNVLIVEFFINCILDPWFLYGGFGLPAMGIIGIALATVVTKALGLCFLLRLALKEDILSLHWKDYLPRMPIWFKIITQSIPASLDMMTIAIGFFTTNYFIHLYGSEAVAAYGICLRIEQIVLLPTLGISMGTLAIVGQNLGAKRLDRIIECLLYSLRLAMIMMTFGAFCMLVFPEILMKAFSDDPKVISVGVDYLRIAALISWSYPLASICIATLQGMQHPYYAMAIGLFRQFIGRIALFSLVVTYTSWELLGIWWSVFVINWFAALITVGYTGYILNVKKQAFAKLDAEEP